MEWVKNIQFCIWDCKPGILQIIKIWISSLGSYLLYSIEGFKYEQQLHLPNYYRLFFYLFPIMPSRFIWIEKNPYFIRYGTII